MIRKLNNRTASLKVMAGAGANAKDARQLIEQSGVQEIHASASVLAMDEQAQGKISFGTQRRITCSDKVRAIKDAITKLP